MKKSIIIALALILLAGSGIAFAEYGSGIKFLNLNVATEEMEEENNDERSNVSAAVHVYLSGDENIMPGDEGFGPAVAERARTMRAEFGRIVSEAARGAGNDNDENNDEERSPVAEAVHEALSGDPNITPEDEEAFGEAVSERARTMGAELGRIVSEAARGAAGNRGNNDR